jgi:hypothetical protein
MDLSLVFIIPSAESASCKLHILLSYYIFCLEFIPNRVRSLQIRVTVFKTDATPQLRSLGRED